MKNSDVSDYVMNCAIELIKQFEGCSLKAYLCPANIWTIGYGHTKCVKNGDVITFDKAEELLKDDIYFLLKVLDRVEVFLTDNQKVALISLIFNIGQTNFKIYDNSFYEQITNMCRNESFEYNFDEIYIKKDNDTKNGTM